MGFRTLLSAADMAVAWTTVSVPVAEIDGSSVQATYSGAPSGTLYVDGQTSGGSWVNLPAYTTAVAASGAATWAITVASYVAFRVRWVPSGGDGELTVTVTERAAAGTYAIVDAPGALLVANVSALQAFVARGDETVTTRGYVTDGDGGGGSYRLDTAPTTSMLVASVTGAGVSPIVVTTQAAHGFAQYDQVQIAGVLGNAAANGTFLASAVTSTTVTLLQLDGSATTGDGAYVSGGVVGDGGTTIPSTVAAYVWRRVLDSSELSAAWFGTATNAARAAALQGALSAAGKLGLKRVVVPHATYAAVRPIATPDTDIVVQGVGAPVITLANSGTYPHVVTVTCTAAGKTALVEAVTVDRLDPLIGGTAAQNIATSTPGVAGYLVNSNGFKASLGSSAGGSVIFSNCVAKNCSRYGFEVFSGYSVSLDNCRASNNGYGGAAGNTDLRFARITGGEYRGNGYWYNHTDGYGITMPADNTIFTGAQFEQNYTMSVDSHEGPDKLTISGCQFSMWSTAYAGEQRPAATTCCAISATQTIGSVLVIGNSISGDGTNRGTPINIGTSISAGATTMRALVIDSNIIRDCDINNAAIYLGPTKCRVLACTNNKLVGLVRGHAILQVFSTQHKDFIPDLVEVRGNVIYGRGYVEVRSGAVVRLEDNAYIATNPADVGVSPFIVSTDRKAVGRAIVAGNRVSGSYGVANNPGFTAAPTVWNWRIADIATAETPGAGGATGWVCTRTGASAALSVAPTCDTHYQTITGATNATPIVITTTGAHGIANDEIIVVAGVTGNTAANGTWKASAVTSTTITLKNFDNTDSVGNGSYAGGGTVGSTTLTSVSDVRELHPGMIITLSSGLSASAEIMTVTQDTYPANTGKITVTRAANAAVTGATISAQTATFEETNPSKLTHGTTDVVKAGSATTLGFYGATPVARPTITGSRGGNAALADLLTQLAAEGLVTDGTTP